MGIGSSSRYEINDRIDGKTVLVTGCSDGIGKHTAQELYRIGGRVIMACRNISKAEQAAEEIRAVVGADDPDNKVGELIIKQLDLASMESIRRCARDVIESETQLNILINNAGMLLPWKPKEMTEDGFEKTFATNHLGHFYLTYLLLPKILSSTPARIVTVSSMVNTGPIYWDDLNLERNYSGMTAYLQSKLANVLFTRELARRLEGTGVTTYCTGPGPTVTGMARDVTVQYVGSGFLHRTLVKLGRLLPFIYTIEESAATSLYCALDSSLVNESGFFYTGCARKEIRPETSNDADAQRLWVESLKLLKLQDIDVKNIPTVG